MGDQLTRGEVTSTFDPFVRGVGSAEGVVPARAAGSARREAGVPVPRESEQLERFSYQVERRAWSRPSPPSGGHGPADRFGVFGPNSGARGPGGFA